MRVARLTDRSGRYYLSDLAVEVPGRGETPGRWMGEGAAACGLGGPVAEQPFARVLRGVHPLNDEPLASTTRRVTAYDLVFCPPKSVSVLFGVGGPEVASAVVAGHDAAVAGAVSYLDAHAMAVRRRSGGERRVTASDGMIAAAFVHGTSRAGDPHLHTHVVTANLARGEDGRWSAVDGRGLFAHGRAAGSLYQSHLRW